MFKRTSKKFVCLVGIALSVVPIFSLAQESNQQIKMLQEIQALRTELAELRDMVEVQQHQLSQMQRGSQTQQLTNRPYQTNQIGQPQQGQLIQPRINPNLRVYSSSQSDIPINPTEVNPQSGTEYVPYSYAGDLNNGEINHASDDVVIEERVIDRNGANTLQGTQNGFPPVEERSIGQGEVASNAIPPSGQYDNNQQTISNIQPSITLNPNGTQTDQAQIIQPQVRAGTNLNPLYQAPTHQQQTSVPIIGQASGQVRNTAGASIPAVLAEKDFYQQGFNLLKQSKHSEAVSVFKQQISSYPQSDLADDAHYWIAESMYVNRDLESAKQYFKVIIENFAQSPRLPDAMLKTAYIEQEQGNKIEARILLQEIIQYHPRSNAAISAKNRLTELN